MRLRILALLLLAVAGPIRALEVRLHAYDEVRAG